MESMGTGMAEVLQRVNRRSKVAHRANTGAKGFLMMLGAHVLFMSFVYIVKDTEGTDDRGSMTSEGPLPISLLRVALCVLICLPAVNLLAPMQVLQLWDAALVHRGAPAEGPPMSRFRPLLHIALLLFLIALSVSMLASVVAVSGAMKASEQPGGLWTTAVVLLNSSGPLFFGLVYREHREGGDDEFDQLVEGMPPQGQGPIHVAIGGVGFHGSCGWVPPGFWVLRNPETGDPELYCTNKQWREEDRDTDGHVTGRAGWHCRGHSLEELVSEASGRAGGAPATSSMDPGRRCAGDGVVPAAALHHRRGKGGPCCSSPLT